MAVQVHRSPCSRLSELLDGGHNETLKLGVHGVLGGLSLLCALYNAAAYGRRPARHLAVNVVIYSALLGLETAQIARHWEHRHR